MAELKIVFNRNMVNPRSKRAKLIYEGLLDFPICFLSEDDSDGEYVIVVAKSENIDKLYGMIKVVGVIISTWNIQDLNSLILKYNFNPKDIVHIGADTKGALNYQYEVKDGIIDLYIYRLKEGISGVKKKNILNMMEHTDDLSEICSRIEKNYCENNFKNPAVIEELKEDIFYYVED